MSSNAATNATATDVVAFGTDTVDATIVTHVPAFGRNTTSQQAEFEKGLSEPAHHWSHAAAPAGHVHRGGVGTTFAKMAADVLIFGNLKATYLRRQSPALVDPTYARVIRPT